MVWRSCAYTIMAVGLLKDFTFILLFSFANKKQLLLTVHAQKLVSRRGFWQEALPVAFKPRNTLKIFLNRNDEIIMLKVLKTDKAERWQTDAFNYSLKQFLFCTVVFCVLQPCILFMFWTIFLW